MSFEPFTKLLIGRSEQSNGLRPAPCHYPARCKIGGYAQLKGLRPYRARLGERLLQSAFGKLRLTCREAQGV